MKTVLHKQKKENVAVDNTFDAANANFQQLLTAVTTFDASLTALMHNIGAMCESTTTIARAYRGVSGYAAAVDAHAVTRLPMLNDEIVRRFNDETRALLALAHAEIDELVERRHVRMDLNK
jgi:hypothetical protein